ncbi:hypothetical protein DL990_41040 [Amycolatopsis sp. WAC 01416]|uniref:hypothetical protein n=1 Tax=Amycolatopsis sp. WAC 01416 TaxID=2203196 RepID=UPI000F77160B|nr:hypothetical protein [Amycolatopsis sp. WAC 01416]RSN19895.1 hypothetical protein DL990_41040 [Amycolatopsis sp. WAC 01416]
MAQNCPDSSEALTTTQTCWSAGCEIEQLKIIQEQVGHAYPSTTSIYTDVSDEYRNRLMHQALGDFAPFMWEAP